MANKPSTDAILRFYSLDELLQLVKEKARQEVNEKMESAKSHLLALTGALGGPSADPEYSAVRGRRGRPKAAKQGTGKRGRPKSTGRASKNGSSERVPLNNLLQEVLSSSPKGIDEIMTDLRSLGWDSKSKDPRRVLYLELGKQVEKGNIQKYGRGKYTKG